MTRQIASGFGAPSIALLEERVRRVEAKVTLLTNAVQALAQELAELKEPKETPTAPVNPQDPAG